MAKQGQIVSKRPQAYLDVSLGSFLAYDIDTILNSLLLSHSSQNLSKVYILYILLNLCTTRRSRLSESYRKMMFRKLPKSLK
nr:MAG TPA: hypothetical protein [Caudoviricetes sp.]